MSQKQIPRLPITAFRVAGRDTALVAPEDMYVIPIHFFAKFGCQKLEGSGRRTASVERDQELTALLDGLHGLFNKDGGSASADVA